MVTKKALWVLFGILVISVWVLGYVTHAGAETMNFKFLSLVTRNEVLPVGDTEGHNVGINVREGGVIFDSGELAWMRAINSFDGVKGIITFDQYYTVIFQDGSKITARTKGSGTPTTSKWTGEIINGTGRFQGIKGTASAEIKFRPREKDELGGKAFGEGTLNYALPAK